ncbi:hypothetical protein EO94_16470 [Methanosarcina sp. 2.H.T.1A.3]|nr:hypothetical protein EO94_16470 [Methanosarcina sp. 2.H.T.1A.3]KKG27176.1 hypothetical protein EO96_09490 [Methanosarcina sp. 2.H.T.1A.8]
MYERKQFKITKIGLGMGAQISCKSHMLPETNLNFRFLLSKTMLILMPGDFKQKSCLKLNSLFKSQKQCI